MRAVIGLLFGLACQMLAIPVLGSDKFYPRAIAIGNTTQKKTQPFVAFTLNSENPVATLDYGHEVAGYPFFSVVSLTGKVQIETKYAEDLGDIDLPYSDGPFTYSQGLTNTYRVETLEVNATGQLNSYFAQGGQRWQTIRLLTPGTVTFRNVGFVATVDVLDYDRLPGRFCSSNPLYNEIWKLGARAAGAACFNSGAYKSVWDVSASSGAFIRGSRVGLSSRGNSFSNYNLTFSAKIERGGLGWAMAYPLLTTAGGIQLNLVGDYPEGTTYANVNRTLLPPNTVVLAYGFSLVNQTTLPAYYLDAFRVPFDVKEGQWYSISAKMYEGNYLAVSINKTKIFNVTLENYYTGTAGAGTTGSFGFGGWQDQAAYFRDVRVTSSNGTVLYANTMTNTSAILPEYGVQSNTADVCLDGAKRDRLAWLGDFYHTAAILATSTSRKDYSVGTLKNFLDWQLPSGQLPLDTALGYPGSATTNFALMTGDGLSYPLEDYHILGLIAFGSHMRYHDDISFATGSWPQWKLAVNYLIHQIDNSTGLVSLGYTFFGDSAGLAVNAASVQALHELTAAATAVGDTASASSWNAIANQLEATIQSKFWQPNLGHFSDTPQNWSKISVQGLSFVITSGVATASQANSCMNALAALKLSPGYKDSTAVSSNTVANISPNTNGFLLSALVQTNRTSEMRYLFENLWAAMIQNDTTHSGASWEYVDTNLQPGLSRYTSLAHPWGGAPTYILTEYIAGIRPVTYGYKTWVIAPAYTGFDLKSAAAQVQTPYGMLKVQWSIASGKIKAVINAPVGTSGTFFINRALANETRANCVVQVEGGILSKSITLDL
ncbi:glycoside hydrolase family 78 protein [Aureobasidium subglaciale EXF-2481]|uniref:Glycoside hydrolase family 78 protein n=1 Tax=Aureobasidium subglaciale (strain EXF-2481) TaxID=1043005 RepID=A0A074Y844_AURSE|nr:glycoside hydrolase family 78 protein [Aureobasidium subglaciale EXF-2481]KAI5200241.1 Six-hairpin glycosidase [Aureobasidium subglaciale]KAI5213306.1 Six-hairpin glycosidase [Aureobasidium subglaciale]KAI5214659.1 Six-hairpin glycosidase [Aureobasidium subglaciale]KAI5252713.1 Six-hairpin glycosidase [Aureobasidium subglaciale]KEQ92119.1 glycoside hydrolase family 78 protein [Aureobasidium subglaciale EXF-2481]